MKLLGDSTSFLGTQRHLTNAISPAGQLVSSFRDAWLSLRCRGMAVFVLRDTTAGGWQPWTGPCGLPEPAAAPAMDGSLWAWKRWGLEEAITHTHRAPVACLLPYGCTEQQQTLRVPVMPSLVICLLISQQLVFFPKPELTVIWLWETLSHCCCEITVYSTSDFKEIFADSDVALQGNEDMFSKFLTF